MKDVHKRLLFEMLNNSRRSDRELAKALSISQPTVTRARRWLEMNNFILEYTLIPDFSKMGFELVVFTFFKVLANVPGGEREQIVKKMIESLDRHPNVVTVLRGEGMGCDGIFVSYHASFSDFSKFVRDLRMEATGIEIVGSFLTSPEGKDRSRPLTFKHLKEYIEKIVEE